MEIPPGDELTAERRCLVDKYEWVVGSGICFPLQDRANMGVSLAVQKRPEDRGKWFGRSIMRIRAGRSTTDSNAVRCPPSRSGVLQEADLRGAHDPGDVLCAGDVGSAHETAGSLDGLCVEEQEPGA